MIIVNYFVIYLKFAKHEHDINFSLVYLGRGYGFYHVQIILQYQHK
jgi:hypothetical protein